MINISVKQSVNIALLTSACVLGGCLSSFIPEPAPADTIYRLSSMGETATPATDAMVVRIDRPAVPTHLNGKFIVVSPDGQRLATASQASWSETVPALLQNSFFDTLSTRAGIVGVLPTSGARSTHRAHLTVRHFEARFDNGPEAAPLIIVHYTATVSDASTRVLKGTYDVRKTQRAAGPNVSAIVTAHDTANKAAMTDIADWMEGLKEEEGV